MKSITDLRGCYELQRNGSVISLHWSHLWEHDPDFMGFVLYHNLTRDGHLYRDLARPLFDLPLLRLRFNYFFSRTYLFAISAAFSDGNLSPISNVLPVVLPTHELPTPRITRAYKVRDQYILQWMFPLDIPDLAGFRLYNNGRMMNFPVMKYQRSLQICESALDPGTISISAFSSHDRSSPMSRQYKL